MYRPLNSSLPRAVCDADFASHHGIEGIVLLSAFHSGSLAARALWAAEAAGSSVLPPLAARARGRSLLGVVRRNSARAGTNKSSHR